MFNISPSAPLLQVSQPRFIGRVDCTATASPKEQFTFQGISSTLSIVISEVSICLSAGLQWSAASQVRDVTMEGAEKSPHLPGFFEIERQVDTACILSTLVLISRSSA